MPGQPDTAPVSEMIILRDFVYSSGGLSRPDCFQITFIDEAEEHSGTGTLDELSVFFYIIQFAGYSSAC